MYVRGTQKGVIIIRSYINVKHELKKKMGDPGLRDRGAITGETPNHA